MTQEWLKKAQDCGFLESDSETEGESEVGVAAKQSHVETLANNLTALQSRRARNC